jgi:hypothetical protein
MSCGERKYYNIDTKWKNIFSSLMMRPNWVEHVPWTNFSSLAWYLQVSLEPTQVNHRDKCSTLFGIVIFDEEKKFYNTDTRFWMIWAMLLRFLLTVSCVNQSSSEGVGKWYSCIQFNSHFTLKVITCREMPSMIWIVKFKVLELY